MNGNPVEIMHTDQGWFDLQNELIGIVDRYMEPRALICMRMDFTSDLCKLIEKYRKYNTGLAKTDAAAFRATARQSLAPNPEAQSR